MKYAQNQDNRHLFINMTSVLPLQVFRGTFLGLHLSQVDAAETRFWDNRPPNGKTAV
ncbi:MAG TPA: hypothetical protein VMC85_08675 [Desulfomonilaceae bacterium]|nr:hypothetical protein [Desulfomonilaceae bacterium]